MRLRGLITNKATPTTAEIFLYDQIGESFFGGGISAKSFAQELRDIGEVDSIDLHINSPGGDVFEADAIYNLLNRSKATVNVMIDGLAASAASYIAMVGDTITVAENAKFMVHNPSGGLMVFDQASVIRAEAEKLAGLLDKIRASMIIVYQARTQKDPVELGALLNAETWYVGQEAVDAGFADAILPAKSVDAHFALLATFKNVPDSLKPEQHQAAKVAFQQVAALTTPVLFNGDEITEWRTRFEALAQSSPYWRDRDLFTTPNTA